MNETLSKEARMMAALRELARKVRDGSPADAVDDCISALRASGIECDRDTFLHRCAASGIGSALGTRLWSTLAGEAHRSQQV